MRFTGEIEPAYALAVLKSPSVRGIVEQRSRQAAQQNFSGPALRQLPMPVPPVDLQKSFVGRLDSIARLRSIQLAAQEELDARFTSLQHRAFRGELEWGRI